jgi:hypothetical protein
MARNPAIELIRGRLDGARADEVLAFWAARSELSAEEAQQRLGEVVCLLRLEGELAGVSSVHAANVALIAGRRFWIYRSSLAETANEQSPAMISATFATLEEQFDGSRGSPIGLCVLIGDPEERRRRPEAEWSDPRLLYAGYLEDGRQVRIAYFEDADTTPDATDH